MRAYYESVTMVSPSHLLSLFLNEFSLFFKLFSYKYETYIYKLIRKHKQLCKKSHIVIKIRILAENNLGGVWVIVWFSPSLWGYVSLGKFRGQRQWMSHGKYRKFQSGIWQICKMTWILDMVKRVGWFYFIFLLSSPWPASASQEISVWQWNVFNWQ